MCAEGVRWTERRGRKGKEQRRGRVKEVRVACLVVERTEEKSREKDPSCPSWRLNLAPPRAAGT